MRRTVKGLRNICYVGATKGSYSRYSHSFTISNVHTCNWCSRYKSRNYNHKVSHIAARLTARYRAIARGEKHYA